MIAWQSTQAFPGDIIRVKSDYAYDVYLHDFIGNRVRVVLSHEMIVVVTPAHPMRHLFNNDYPIVIAHDGIFIINPSCWEVDKR